VLNILSSDAREPNPKLREAPREARQNNVRWIETHLPEIGGDGVTLLLLGGTDNTHFRLRLAQAHLRHDFSPSPWSHVALLGPPGDDLGRTPLVEIALDAPGGLGRPVAVNAVQEGRLSTYRSARRFPNIAILRIAVDPDSVEDALRRFRMQRMVLDAVELVLLWLAFVWGVGRSQNPLLDGHGTPSAAMLDVVLGAAEYDLTPGLESRASCPEAIWQSIRWWHAFYEEQTRDLPEGRWTAPHTFVSRED
jgi:hypothetical protein